MAQSPMLLFLLIRLRHCWLRFPQALVPGPVPLEGAWSVCFQNGWETGRLTGGSRGRRHPEPPRVWGLMNPAGGSRGQHSARASAPRGPRRPPQCQRESRASRWPLPSSDLLERVESHTFSENHTQWCLGSPCLSAWGSSLHARTVQYWGENGAPVCRTPAPAPGFESTRRRSVCHYGEKNLFSLNTL